MLVLRLFNYYCHVLFSHIPLCNASNTDEVGNVSDMVIQIESYVNKNLPMILINYQVQMLLS